MSDTGLCAPRGMERKVARSCALWEALSAVARACALWGAQSHVGTCLGWEGAQSHVARACASLANEEQCRHVPLLHGEHVAMPPNACTWWK